MRSRLIPAVKLLAAAAAVLTGLVLLKPDTGVLALRLYLLLLGSVAVVLLVAAIRDVLPPPSGDFERTLGPSSRADQLGQLAEVEREVELAVSREFYFHSTLRPLLQQLAADRLRIRHGISLDDPLARDLLGPQAWELVRRDREPPRDRVAPGPPPEALRHVVEALEAL